MDDELPIAMFLALAIRSLPARADDVDVITVLGEQASDVENVGADAASASRRVLSRDQ